MCGLAMGTARRSGVAVDGLVACACVCGPLLQKYDFGLSPSAVQFFLQMDAVAGKISGATGSPNLLLQVNGV